MAAGDTLWVLDSPQVISGAVPAPVKLVRLGLEDAKVQRIYTFEDLPVGSVALNDVRIDTRRSLAYLSDPKRAALVVLDLMTGMTRTLLAGTRPTSADPNYVLHLDGHDVVDSKGRPFANNVNGIALSNDGEWFYFRAITQSHLYRIRTSHLADASLSDAALLSHVEDLGDVGVSRGMFADKEGNVYMTDSINYAITKWSPGKALSQVVVDPRLSWPETLALGSDGTLYITAAQINRTKFFSTPERVDYPFRVYKVSR